MYLMYLLMLKELISVLWIFWINIEVYSLHLFDIVYIFDIYYQR